VAYTVSLQHVEPRPIAAVRAQIPIRDVPSRFREYLDQVYAAAKTGAISLDGQNIFVYHATQPTLMEIEFGVGAKAPFAPVGRVEYRQVPGGNVATTTHWGDYALLGPAHQAVVDWCKTEGLTLAGISWEVYGHWSDDPSKRRTDIYQLLRV